MSTSNAIRPRKLDQIPAGEDVVIGTSRSTMLSQTGPFEFDLRMCTVVDGAADPAILKDRAGNILELSKGVITGERAGLFWTDMLPNGTDEQVLAYCTSVALTSAIERGAATGFFHVHRVEGGVAYARHVFPRGCASRTHSVEHDDPGIEMSTVGNATYSELELELVHGKGDGELEFDVGDLIAAAEFSVVAECESLKAKLDYARAVGTFVGREAVGAFFNSLDETADRWGGSKLFIADESHLRIEIDRAHARNQPNEALFLWAKTWNDKTACRIVAHSGIYFHEIDDAQDYFWDDKVEAGLWVFENASFWSSRSYEGEYDAGFDGNFRPATPEDLARFGVTLEMMIEEIADFAEVDADPGLAERYLAMASASRDAQAPSPVA